MEKKRPTYDLQAFREWCRLSRRIEMTLGARRDALALGFNLEGVQEVISSMEVGQFYKSMTSYQDHTVWQDVYHVPWGDLVLYIKFTADRVTEFRVLSFKER